MRQARRIQADIEEANKLPDTKICCKDERMDLLFADVGFVAGSKQEHLRMPLLIQVVMHAFYCLR